MTGDAVRGGERALVRVMGVRALAATIFNIMIGGGIFLLPAVAAAELGAAAPVAYLVCALAMGLVVLCFAEAGSRVSLTGGPYAYVEVAFGPFAGFLAGVLLWLVGSFATAAVASGLVGSLAGFWSPLGVPVPRMLLLTALFAGLALVNVRGVREGARLVEVVTVAKLLPLVLFVADGAFFVHPAKLAWSGVPAVSDVGSAAIVLIFAFAGIESALVPSGEVRDPARTVPRALFIAMAAVTLLYIAIQLVAQGLLAGEMARHQDAPLAAAAQGFAGRPGALVLLVGATISMVGFVSGMTLATPRTLFALGRDGILPGRLAAIHPRFRTPHVAIAVQSAIACVLAITGSFAALAILANVSVLVLYLFCCAAVLELRRRDVRAGGIPFRVPGGWLVPVLAIAVLLWLLRSATMRELGIVAGALGVAALLFVLTAPARRVPASSEP
jgi:amino acid transporter